MRVRDLIEHKIKTKLSGPDKSALRGIKNDEEDEEAETPILDLGVFDSPSLQPGPDASASTTPGATAAAFRAPAGPMFESGRFLDLITEVSFMTYVSVIAKQTGTNIRDWEEADGPQIGPGKDHWYVHKTTNEIVQVTVTKGKATFKRSTEGGEPIDAWELT